MSVYEDWKEGWATSTEALNGLLSDLQEVQEVKARAVAEEERIRAALSEVVDAMGGRVEVGATRLTITAPFKRVRYDSKKLDKLIVDLVPTHPELAARIRAARSETMQTGSLQIRTERRSE